MYLSSLKGKEKKRKTSSESVNDKVISPLPKALLLTPFFHADRIESRRTPNT